MHIMGRFVVGFIVFELLLILIPSWLQERKDKKDGYHYGLWYYIEPTALAVSIGSVIIMIMLAAIFAIVFVVIQFGW
jgi:hypothetical protein